MIQSQVGTSETILDLTKFQDWQKTKKELRTILRNRTFWSNSSLIIRFAGFEFDDYEVAELNEILQNSDSLFIKELQTTSPETLEKFQKVNLNASQIGDNVSLPPPKIRLLRGRQKNVNKNMNSQSSDNSCEPKLISLDSFDRPLLPPGSLESQTAYIGLQDSVALRAGSEVFYEGNLVVFGDVNPGCQIRATGSIIVYGKLSGSVHAGYGVSINQIDKIVVKALKMYEPIQISIGDFSACSIHGDVQEERHKLHPETAKVIEGRIWRISDFE